MELREKTCIITGASGHLGAATVDLFLSHGARVFGLVSPRSKDVPAERPGLQWLSCDATSEQNVRQTWDLVHAQSGRLDVFIHGIGGIYPWSTIPGIETDVWNRTVELNLTTAFLCARESLRLMIPARRGKIVLVGALAGLSGKAKAGPYGAAKAALMNLTQTVADENRANNIQVNMIVPGIIDTPSNRLDMPDADTTGWVQSRKIADVLVFLASDRSECITGSIIKVTGKL